MIQNNDAPQENSLSRVKVLESETYPSFVSIKTVPVSLNQSTTRSGFKSSVDTVRGVPDAGLTAALMPRVSVCEHKRFQREAGTSRVKYNNSSHALHSSPMHQKLGHLRSRRRHCRCGASAQLPCHSVVSAVTSQTVFPDESALLLEHPGTGWRPWTARLE